MTDNQYATYARQLADAKRETAEAKQAEKDLEASATDAGLNIRAIRRAAKELLMDADKRAKLYDDDAQLDLLRDALKLTEASRQTGFEDRFADDGLRVAAE